jgi:enamine deaminase RidA (YjgF/YER057c/UK114 family)
MTKRFLNPPSLFPSEQYGFSQIAVVRGGTTVYLAGQVAWNQNQEISGRADLGTQTTAALMNVERALAEVGGTRNDIVAMRVYIRDDYLHDDTPVQEALKGFFTQGSLPVGTWIGVPALANPDFLVEIEAIAVID